jgi:transcriptional regulator with XRE-family HTH domain
MSGEVDFAALIEKLLDENRKLDGSRYSYAEIESGTDGEVSQSYISKLHQGKTRNPTVKKVRALAGFFGVSPSYFFQEEKAEEKEIDEVVARIAKRAARLDDRGRHALIGFLRHIEAANSAGKGEGDGQSNS